MNTKSMWEEVKPDILKLLRAAANAPNAVEAMQYAQAALSAAQVVNTISLAASLPTFGANGI